MEPYNESRRGPGRTLFLLGGLALLIAAGIYLWPDLRRYIRIRTM
jgi:hypothetical protein